MKTLNVKLGNIQGTEVEVAENDIAPLNEKEIAYFNKQELANTPLTEEEKQADATNKANGNQKLLDLGLTQAEATALTGYTPPVAE